MACRHFSYLILVILPVCGQILDFLKELALHPVPAPDPRAQLKKKRVTRPMETFA